MQIGLSVQKVMLANSKWLKNHFKGNGFKCNLVNREFVVRIFLLVRWKFIRLSHNGIAFSCWSRRFDCNTASLHQAMRSIVYVSRHLPIWKEVKFIDRDPHWYTCRVKEAIHIRLHPNNINRDSGIEIPEAWMPIATIRKHNSRPTTKRTCEGTTSNSLRIEMHQ